MQDNIVDENVDTPLSEQSEVSELVELKKKADEYLDGWKRAKADYLNYKRDMEKRQEEMAQYANAALIFQLLPAVDHLRIALSHVPKDQESAEWVKGLFHVKRQFDEFLKRLGIEQIKTVGEKFNPELHEAIESVAQEGVESDMVIEELTAGYTLNGKVVNPAKVKVTK